MKIDKEDKKFILSAWQKEFPEFVKGSKIFLARLNGFALVSIDLLLDSATTYYRIRVSTHVFHHDDATVRFCDKENEYYYSLGQHGRKIRTIGEHEQLSVLCNRIKSETASKDNLTLPDFISYLNHQPSNAVFRPFYNIEAIFVSNFFLGGTDYAVERLDTESHNFALWPEATRVMLGGSWQAWREKVINKLDKKNIETNKEKFLESFRLQNKIKDYGMQ